MNENTTGSATEIHRPSRHLLRSLVVAAMARYFHQCLAVQYHRTVDLAQAGQSGAGFFRHQFSDDDGDDDRIADLDSATKVQRLRDVDRTGPGQPRSKAPPRSGWRCKARGRCGYRTRFW